MYDVSFRSQLVVPVKLYVWVMVIAGAVMLIYGLATSQTNVALGSFIFIGMGGLVHFLSNKRR
jgi:hypothetical protein